LDEIITDQIFGLAGTNCQFRDLYNIFLQRKDQEKIEDEKKKTTQRQQRTVPSSSFRCLSYYSSIVESLSRTKMWLKETHNGKLNSELRKDHRENHAYESQATPLNFIAKVAACSGSLQVLEWSRQNGCDWNARVCSAAARNGHFGVLKWARQNDCDWNAEVCDFAAKGGHLEVLQWARQNDCDWNARVCTRAAEGGIWRY
jgi:hypothetical protein